METTLNRTSELKIENSLRVETLEELSTNHDNKSDLKKAIVIGGTTGIGKGIASILLEKGFQVTVTGIEKDFIENNEYVGHKNLKIEYLDCIKDSSSRALNGIIKKIGGLDLLILSAGIGNLNKDLGYKVENWANQLNVFSFTEIVDFTYRFFQKQGFGHLVAISSIAGLIGNGKCPAYHAAKAYQISYMEGLRQRAKKDRRDNKQIYVTDIRPGFVKTAMTKGKKMIWAASVKKVAKQIFKYIQKKKGYGYVSKRWLLVALIIKVVPTWVRVRF
ncbi:SDR family NAD(P)-dependent oxidoreductase [Aegicerativicinus sediminis]|uniref:SDR family NAD(P)-dependent oxidoreductase n=1 Tax=Aegicerativicinus sediminis TaxID=2893202 RepID=UPI001E362C9A|nr:SDR family NAD(P)-dependent oxidoreductase [Aegicerativicinus sediminis]